MRRNTRARLRLGTRWGKGLSAFGATEFIGHRWVWGPLPGLPDLHGRDERRRVWGPLPGLPDLHSHDERRRVWKPDLHGHDGQRRER